MLAVECGVSLLIRDRALCTVYLDMKSDTILELFADTIQWPEEEDWYVQAEAKDRLQGRVSGQIVARITRTIFVVMSACE